MMCRVFLILCVAVATWARAAEQEVVQLWLAEGVQVELRAEKVESAEREFAPGVCVWRGQLWEPTMTNPPEKVLVSGVVELEGKRVELDVTGLAAPWIDPGEKTPQDCRLRRRELGENRFCYILDICFFKGGALDYVVTWEIYEAWSRRIRIEGMGDDYPEWYTPETPDCTE